MTHAERVLPPTHRHRVVGLGVLAIALGALVAAGCDGLLAISRAPLGALSAGSSSSLIGLTLALWCAPAFVCGLALELFLGAASRQPRVVAAGRWFAAGPRTWFPPDADASLATALVCLGGTVAFAPVYPVALFVGTTFHSRPLAALAVFVALLACMITAALVVLVCAAPLAWCFRRAGRLASPGAVVVAASVFALVLAARFVRGSRTLLASLDGALFVVPMLFALVGVVALIVLFRIRRRAVAWLALGVLVVEALLPVVALRALDSHPVAAHALYDGAAFAGSAVAMIRGARDRDHDTFGPWAGGGDCNDRDVAVHPGAIDVPGNGRDEDCTGHDAVTRRFVEPAARPRPAAARELTASHPSIVLITVEGLAAGSCASPPFPDFPRDAMCFSHAYTAADRVDRAVAAAWTGRYASELPWTATGSAATLGEDVVTVAERALDAGYFTASFANSDVLARHAGLHQGFVERHDGHGTPADLADTTRRVLEVLTDRTRDKRATFLHVHFDSTTALGARAIAGVLRALVPLRDARPMVLVLAGVSAGRDAGEGTTLREAALRIPLWIQGPGVLHRERDEPCSLVDLAPTLYELTGARAPGTMEGRSLVPWLVDPRAETAPRTLVAEGFETDDAIGASRIAWFDHGHELIAAPSRLDWALYDLARDPGERANRFDPGSEPSRSMREDVSSYRSFAAHQGQPLGAARLEAAAPASDPRAQHVGAHYTELMDLESVDTLPHEIAPGGTLAVTLTYQTLGRASGPQWFQIAFEPVTPGAGPIPPIRRWPLDGRDPTHAWPVQERRRETFAAEVPTDARPGLIRLRFSLLSDRDLAPVTPRSGGDADGSVLLGSVAITAPARR